MRAGVYGGPCPDRARDMEIPPPNTERCDRPSDPCDPCDPCDHMRPSAGRTRAPGWWSDSTSPGGVTERGRSPPRSSPTQERLVSGGGSSDTSPTSAPETGPNVVQADRHSLDIDVARDQPFPPRRTRLDPTTKPTLGNGTARVMPLSVGWWDVSRSASRVSTCLAGRPTSGRSASGVAGSS
jgi:hypothetical protein